MYTLFSILVGIPVVTTFIIHFLEFCIALLYRNFCTPVSQTPMVTQTYTLEIKDLLEEYKKRLDTYKVSVSTQTDFYQEIQDR